MKLVQGLAILAVAVAALWLLQRRAPADSLTIKDLHASHAGQYPPTFRLKAVVRHGSPHEPYLVDVVCDPAGQDISPLIVDARLDRSKEVQALYMAAIKTGQQPDRRLVAILKVQPRYTTRLQPPGVGPKPASFSGVRLIAVESYAYETRPDAAVAWRCDRPAPPRPEPQGQR
ncbi:MAG: hypothetical protein EON95_18710 [Caulobacteraceae bacterium]|nr:MAG: hypothetical protein EON95_18710 [Caulobacteraceae bacterium]